VPNGWTDWIQTCQFIQQDLAQLGIDVQVRTPEPSVDLLANGWLLYQTIACRFLARSGYYQSGGHSAFATSCRTAWPWSTRSRR